MFVKLSARRCYRFSSLSSHRFSFYRVFSASVSRTFSSTSQISSSGEGSRRTTASYYVTDFSAFSRYLKGHFTEPYGGQGEESREHFVQTLTKAFESVAQTKCTNSSDRPQSINASDFLITVFSKIEGYFMNQRRNSSVHFSYCHWVRLFFDHHVLTLETSRAKMSVLRDLTDTIQTFLEEYAGMDHTELKTRTTEIVNEICLCMEDYLDCLASEQVPKGGGLSPRASGLMHREDWNTLLFTTDLQKAWKRPFRGKSLMLLKQKLALNVDALQKVRRLSKTKISKLEMSRIIPILQSSGTGKSRLSEE
jgi:hypothetical protein